jgi:GT2 family glycosyltransferase
MDAGFVVIGRNEGQRLARCLASLAPTGWPLVYVDSGSGDGSPQLAADCGAVVVALDMAQPFTAARARNAGLAMLASLQPSLRFVHFVDGDCVIDGAWPAAALACLAEHPDVAVVCGRRREIRPDASVYNWLCDREWDTPVGEAIACGGDALMRFEAVAGVGGYRNGLIAGEEPELCLRLREAGWRVVRLDREMTLHDANITRFGQWWRRTLRGGFAFASVLALHSRSPRRIWLKEVLRALAWGAALPSAILVLAWLYPVAAGLLLIYPLQVARLAARGGDGGWRFALFMMMAKFAEAAGILKYVVLRITGHTAGLIEYK